MYVAIFVYRNLVRGLTIVNYSPFFYGLLFKGSVGYVIRRKGIDYFCNENWVFRNS